MRRWLKCEWSLFLLFWVSSWVVFGHGLMGDNFGFCSLVAGLGLCLLGLWLYLVLGSLVGRTLAVGRREGTVGMSGWGVFVRTSVPKQAYVMCFVHASVPGAGVHHTSVSR